MSNNTNEYNKVVNSIDENTSKLEKLVYEYQDKITDKMIEKRQLEISIKTLNELEQILMDQIKTQLLNK